MYLFSVYEVYEPAYGGNIIKYYTDVYEANGEIRIDKSIYNIAGNRYIMRSDRLEEVYDINNREGSFISGSTINDILPVVIEGDFKMYYDYWKRDRKDKCPCNDYRGKMASGLLISHIINCPCCKRGCEINYKPTMFSIEKFIQIKREKNRKDMEALQLEERILNDHEERIKKMKEDLKL